MKIEFEISEEVLVIKLSGKFDSLGSIDFEKAMVRYAGNKYIILDFSEVKYLSSSGIRNILKLEKDSKIMGGMFVLSGINQIVNQVLTMTGLRTQLTIHSDIKEALAAIENVKKTETKKSTFSNNNCSYQLYKLDEVIHPLKSLLVSEREKGDEKYLPFSLEELNYSVGFGGIGLNRTDLINNKNLVLTLDNFIGFRTVSGETHSDFIFAEKRADVFMYLKEGLSFAGEPNAAIDFISDSEITIQNILSDINKILGDESSRTGSVVSYIFIGKVIENPGNGDDEWIIANGILVDKLTASQAEKENLKQFVYTLKFFNCNDDLCAGQIEILLKYSEDLSARHKLGNDLNSLLSFDNIKSVEESESLLSYSKGRIYLFYNDRIEKLKQNLEIDNLHDLNLTDEFEIIVRRIYSDCSKIQLVPLLGGFSARTFQVFGEDRNGAKILPTVLKLSNSAIIKREEDNFEDYVKKFILNNASTVMGSFYFGDFGGIRYNFLGITGSTKLKWLRKAYNERTFEEIEPLFDKVYTGILKPWYGQPKLENMNLYKEQNPVHFFPVIFDKAREVLGISADEPNIFIEELNREAVNPYHFLKYGYPKRESQTFTCYKGICHGDLNLQNILLDEKENIYIIDFSETKYRNALSDFARLEPIIKYEYFNIETKEALTDLIEFEKDLLECNSIKEVPRFVYAGSDPEVEKGYKLIMKMREYAATVSLFEKSIVPYLIAMLEWSLPVIVYYGINIHRLRYSMISCSLMVEKILRLEEKS
ncbi:MAG: STAS domain-containing protein [Ignavibacteriaceae bacterium]